MDRIDFDRIARHEWRIRLDGEIVGDVLRMPDVLAAGAALFVIHLSEDYRGPVRVGDPARVRPETARMIDTHPLWR